jgi:hypothetical protein
MIYMKDELSSDAAAVNGHKAVVGLLVMTDNVNSIQGMRMVG